MAAKSYRCHADDLPRWYMIAAFNDEAEPFPALTYRQRTPCPERKQIRIRRSVFGRKQARRTVDKHKGPDDLSRHKPTGPPQRVSRFDELSIAYGQADGPLTWLGPSA